MKTENIDYSLGKISMRGYLARPGDGSTHDLRPAVILVHDFLGIAANRVQAKTHAIADLGYVGFAADIFGVEHQPKNRDEGSALVKAFRENRTDLRNRTLAAYDCLKKQPGVDHQKIAIIGFCFGGMAALECARTGCDLQVAASFHGSPDTPAPDGTKIRAKILVMHGADDFHISQDSLLSFEKEMRAAKVDWQLVKYGNAVHSFTEPEAGSDNSTGSAYNEKADRRSWLALKNLLAEAF